MTFKLIIEPPAEADIKEAYQWYKNIQPELASRLRLSLRIFFRRILQYPQVYPIVGKKFRRGLISDFPYAVFYVCDGEIIRVFAVMHNSRDPKIWKMREH